MGSWDVPGYVTEHSSEFPNAIICQPRARRLTMRLWPHERWLEVAVGLLWRAGLLSKFARLNGRRRASELPVVRLRLIV
jgi:hypothetical protein